MSATFAGEILIADDEADICFGLARMVKRHGLVPHVVADGKSAVDLFRTRRGLIRAMFLDVRMPRLNGVEAWGQMRAIDPAVPCCLMTAFRLDRAFDDLVGRAAVPVLNKPFDLSEALDALGAMLKQSEPPETKIASQMKRIALAFPPRYALWADVIRGATRYAREARIDLPHGKWTGS